MAAASLEVVVKQLKDSGIIAPGKLENFIPPNAHPKDAAELARELVKSENLTPFQAQQVLHGRARSLSLGNYTILDKLGAGGMGQVFKARHRRMDRIVAVKMLPTKTMKDAAAVARFEREVRAAAKLRHPNIVAADDADEAHGVHFLVMEYVEGRDLSALVKKDGPFAVEKAVNCILQAAGGLEFAHSKGVVHRDIKPANLLLSSDGSVKILDMGLARIEVHLGDATPAELTGTGAIMGTVDYMAPEQGVSTKDADARADIYSLGCTLHFLLTSKPVYEAESVAARLLAHHQQPIPDLCKLRNEVPQHLQQVFAKMVAKKREDRYQTMSEVIAALQTSGVSHDQSLSMQTFGTTVDTDAFTFLREVQATTLKPHATKKGASAPKGRGGRKLVCGIAAAVLGVMMVAGVIFKLQTKDGTLVVEIDQPDAEVQILSEAGKVEISRPGGQGLLSISVDPGKHRLRIEKEGFVVYGQDFEIVAGDRKPIKAALVPVRKEVIAAVASGELPKALVAPFDAVAAHTGQAAWARHLRTNIEQKNTVGMTLVLIPPGEFLMGSSPEENALGVKMAQDAKVKSDSWEYGRLKEEGPQHRVSITKPYWLGSTEVTVGQFKKFVEATKHITDAEKFGFGNSHLTTADATVKPEQMKMTWRAPGYTITDDSPVTQVSWNDAVQFLNWLSDQEKLKPCYRQDAKSGWINLASGTGYRLPTEAEWEYACRAGTTTQFSFGDDPAMLDIYGWFNKNAGGSARAVGLKVANPFGLFNMMHGNVSEWCQDFYAADYYSKSSPNDPTGPSSGSNRVYRGGNWNYNPVFCRSAFRNNNAPVSRGNTNGFRCVRVVDSSTSLAADATTPVAALATTARPSAPAVRPIETPPAERASVPKLLVAPFDAQQAHAGQAAWAKYLKTTVEQKNPEGMTLVLIPPGEFLMGATSEQSAVGRKMAEDAKVKSDSWEWQRLKEEGPQHRVSITKPYWLGMTEVTIGQFKKFVEATKYVTQAEQFGFGNSGGTKLDDKITPEQKKMTWRTPGYVVTDDSPVTQVSWNDCVVFCNWMSDQEKLKSCYRQDAKSGWINLASGTGYRLPTEAEWEYACRAGTTTQFSFGDDPAMLDIYGWFNKNAGGSARAVGLKVANPFGLFDMHGNAQEWCHDWYAADYYSKSSPVDPFGPSSGSAGVIRGGNCNNNPVNCGSAFRHYSTPVNRNVNYGFRCVRVR